MTAWVLNLDADLELAHRGPYTPSQAVLAAMAPHAAVLATTLLRPDDVLVDDARARGRRGRAFCPTPRAIAILERAGAIPEPFPPTSVLRRANGRAFCASLGQTLPGAAWVTDAEDASAILARPPPIGERWRVKRAFGMAGRGQRTVAPVPDADDRVFLRAALEDGGVQIEPNVAIVRELARHGMLARGGALVVGRVVEQRCDPRGQWLSSSIASDLDPGLLGDEIERVGVALDEVGYFGPFGIDAFLYRDGARLVLQPRSEINARYSMGFAVGFMSPL